MYQELSIRSKVAYEKMYVVDGMSYREIAAHLCVSYGCVQKDVRRFQIKTRPQMRHPELKRDFFDCHSAQTHQ